MSFITHIRLVADCTAAECKAIDSFVLLLCFDASSGLWSSKSGEGLLVLLEPFSCCQQQASKTRFISLWSPSQSESSPVL